MVSLIVTLGVVAQGDPVYRQNHFNAMMLNPAHAGSNTYSDVSVLALNQWVGMPGAPRTYTVSGNFKILENAGLGVAVLGDQYGPVNVTNADVNLAYHLKLNKKYKLSMAIRGSIYSANVGLTDLTIINSNDPYFQSNLSTGLSGNAGWGALLYSNKFYVGVSQPRLVRRAFSDRNMNDFVDSQFGLISYMGGNFNLNRNVIFRPYIVSRYLKNTPYNFDMNAILNFNKKIDFGLTYQLLSGAGLIFGVDFGNLYLGYAYTYPMNDLRRASFQSHEVSIRFKFNDTKTSMSQSPRFFMN
jgi:type IX secretion system PorP/SprF family membrane protein